MAGTTYRELVEDSLASLAERRDRILERADRPTPSPGAREPRELLAERAARRDEDEQALIAEGTGVVLDFARVIGYGLLAIAEGLE